MDYEEKKVVKKDEDHGGSWSREFYVHGNYPFGKVHRWVEFTDGSIRVKAVLDDGRTILARTAMGHICAVRNDVDEERFFAGYTDYLY